MNPNANEALFYRPFYLPPTADVFRRRAKRLLTIAPQDDWGNYLHLVAAICQAQQQVFDDLRLPEMTKASTTPYLPAVDEPLPAALMTIFVPTLQALKNAFCQRQDQPNLQATWDLLDDFSLPRDADLLRQILLNAPLQQACHRQSAIWLSATLQLIWTHWACHLTDAQVRPHHHRHLCPACHQEAVASLIYSGGDSDGLRYMHCPLCNSRWNALRAICSFCGDSSSMSLYHFEANEDVYQGARAEACDHCHSYRKLFLCAAQINADPIADDLASLPLDIQMAEQGYQRGGHQPFLLDSELS